MNKLLASLVVFAVVGAATPLAQRGQRPHQGRQVQRGQQGSMGPGDMAVDFTLEPRDGGAAVTLSAFRGRSPVALVFGSYT